MAFSFFGGVHPAENKSYARDKAVQDFPEPDILVVPMSQHIGAPCKPLVKKNDLVTKGQKIGDNTGLCVPVHAPVSGKVKSVEMKPHSNGTTVMSVVIENDHLGTLHEDIKPRTQAEVDALTPEELINIVREAGIVGMGGASFPTHVKLSGGIGKVDTIIVNAGECEPYITSDDRLCREMPEQLIQAITGRQVPSGGLPAAVGCAVFNAATCKAIHDAVYEGMPLIKRIVTVSGDVLMEPKNLMVPIGTSYNDLIEACGFAEYPYKVLNGGPMMGSAQYDLSVTTIKACNAVTVLGKKNKYAIDQSKCIRCGKCIDVCPMKLMPVLMYKACMTGDPAEMNAVNMMDCIECGCCAYNCPACVPLVLSFRSGKHIIREAAAAAKK